MTFKPGRAVSLFRLPLLQDLIFNHHVIQKMMPINYLFLLALFGNMLANEGAPTQNLQVGRDPRLPGMTTQPEKDTLKFPPCDVEDIPSYTAYKMEATVQVDGKLDEAVWKEAPRSTSFRDLISGESTIHETTVAVLWDDDFLYVGYWIEEPDLQATLTDRDAPIYTDNDVELFIAGEDAYYEFEINAYGTIYEVLFIWEASYATKGYSRMEAFDRERPGVRPFNGVGYKNHPRGGRIGFWNWDFPGLEHAVFLDGTINDDRDRDRGWTVELALPWSGMEVLSLGDQVRLPPRDNDVWRMDFSRFNQYKEAPPANDSGGWAWSPHGVWDSHVPECFTSIRFSERGVLKN